MDPRDTVPSCHMASKGLFTLPTYTDSYTLKVQTYTLGLLRSDVEQFGFLYFCPLRHHFPVPSDLASLETIL